MKSAKCIAVRYIPGEYQTRQGYKGGGYGQSFYKNGYYHNTQGFGWAKCYKPSKLILLVERKGKVHEIWIDHFFKTNVGKLTSKRISLLTATMPDTIRVHKCQTMDGGMYYTADDMHLAAWQKTAGL